MTDDALEAERQNAERLAQAHAAVAKAQERSYWLDRWQVDLNALMQRPAATRGLELLRAAKLVKGMADKTRNALEVQRQAGHPGGPPPEGTSLGGGFARSISPRPVPAAPVSEALFGRLTAEDVASVEQALDPAEEIMVANASPADRMRLLLSFGVHHRVPGVLERSGLTAAEPPDAVHSMGRGAAAAGGSPYYGDLVAEAFETAGFPLASATSGLDFGASSGRVVRVLAAAYPGLEWAGCDPIADAVEWADQNLPGIAFAQSPEEPPLSYADGSFDRVYAISIWSHFAEQAALAWLDEMHRIIRPGGALLLTTHGFHTVAHDLAVGRRGPGQLAEIRAALYEHGFWFKDEFGDHGDHGVGGADWGSAFLTPEWLAWHATPTWRIAGFAPGRVEDNQDAYVLERR